MILDRKEFTTLREFIVDNCGTAIGANAVQAWHTYMSDTEDTDTYAVIRVNGYYAVTKITDEWQPITVSEFVQPFDKEKVYPLQRVHKVIDWIY